MAAITEVIVTKFRIFAQHFPFLKVKLALPSIIIHTSLGGLTGVNSYEYFECPKYLNMIYISFNHKK